MKTIKRFWLSETVARCRNSRQVRSNSPGARWRALVPFVVLALVAPVGVRAASAPACSALFAEREQIHGARSEFVKAVRRYRMFQQIVDRYLQFLPALARHDNDRQLTRLANGETLLKGDEALYIHKAGKLADLTLPEAERRYALALAWEVRDRRFAVAEEIIGLLLRRYESERPGQAPPEWTKAFLARAFQAFNHFPRMPTQPTLEPRVGKPRLFSNAEIDALVRVIELEAAKERVSSIPNGGQYPLADHVLKERGAWNSDENFRRRQIKILIQSGLSTEKSAHDDLSAMREFFGLQDNASEFAKEKCCGQGFACPHCIRGRSFSQRAALRHGLKDVEKIKAAAYARLLALDVAPLEPADVALLDRLLRDQPMSNDDWFRIAKIRGLELPKSVVTWLAQVPPFDISTQALQEIKMIADKERALDLKQAPPELLLEELAMFGQRKESQKSTGESNQ